MNKSWKQHSTKQQLYGHLPPISKTTKARWTRHERHSWSSKDELISNVLLWTPSHGWASIVQPVKTYLQYLYADTECSLEDLPKVMDDREEWQWRVIENYARGMTWWWGGYIYIYIYIYIYMCVCVCVCVCLCVCVCKSFIGIFLFILSIYLSITVCQYQSIYLSIDQSISVHIYQSIYLSIWAMPGISI